MSVAVSSSCPRKYPHILNFLSPLRFVILAVRCAERYSKKSSLAPKKNGVLLVLPKEYLNASHCFGITFTRFTQNGNESKVVRFLLK